jgi:hypothetical protein
MFYSIPDNFATVDASGLITVSPINRDEGFDQVTLTVTAIEVEQPDSTTVGTILLILEDIDDSIPEISVLDSAEKKIEITIDEGASDVPVDIVVTDLDLVSDQNLPTLLLTMLVRGQMPSTTSH